MKNLSPGASFVGQTIHVVVEAAGAGMSHKASRANSFERGFGYFEWEAQLRGDRSSAGTALGKQELAN